MSGKLQDDQFLVDKLGNFIVTDSINLFQVLSNNFFYIFWGLIESVILCLKLNHVISFFIVKYRQFKLDWVAPLIADPPPLKLHQ